jgi:outer membrane protein OmpA-like peptidoglycan-associated protein
MKSYILLISLLFIVFSAFSQPLNSYKYETMLETADECFEKRDYQNALEFYNKALDEKKETSTMLKIAETYYMLRNYKLSARTVKGILAKDKTGTYNDYKLLYAKNLKRLGQYQDAYNEFKDYYQKSDDPEGKEEATLEIKGLELFNSLDENVEMEFKPLGGDINKGFSVYGAQKRFGNDTLYIGSFNTSKKVELDGKSDKSKKESSYESDSRSNSDSGSKSEPRSGSRPDSNSGSKSDSRSKSNSDLNSGSLSGDSSGSKSESNSRSDMNSRSDSDSGSDSGSSSESRSNSNKNSDKDSKSGTSRAQILLSSRDEKGDYNSIGAMDKRFNGAQYHSIYPAFSPSGTRMFFTREAMEGTVILESKIMYSELNKGEWSAPLELPVVNGDFKSKMPSFGEILGREALFFSSDMPGGQGGFDIYYSLMNDDGTFELPVNLGKNINTRDDEITPYFVDGKLYFSSNGFLSLGGFDIYKSSWNGREWSTSENLGKGFNSSVDDLGLTISADGRSGFLLSNRPYQGKKKLDSETCCDHVFRVSARDLVIQLLVEVYDDKGELNDAKVELVDVSKVKPLAPESKSNFSGNKFNFLLDPDRSYQAVVTKDGYDSQKVPFTTAGIFDDYTITKKVTLVKAAPEFVVVKINEPIRLNNIYYDRDDYKILPEAEDDLEKLLDLMNQYPDMVIELSSHTDSRASDKYNIKLSQNRADAAKKWLEKNGIDAKRVVPIGYGETMILNKCKNDVNCTEEEHRFNRRTEFKIIKGPKEITIEKKIFKDKNNTQQKTKK